MSKEHRNLGHPAGDLGPHEDAWLIDIDAGDGIVPVLFTRAQAIEIAARINAHYGAYHGEPGEIFLDPSGPSGGFIGDLQPPYNLNGQLVCDLRFMANGRKWRLPVLFAFWKICAQAECDYMASNQFPDRRLA